MTSSLVSMVSGTSSSLINPSTDSTSTLPAWRMFCRTVVNGGLLYAALYVENAWDRADEFAQYFADEIAYRSDDGLAISNVDGFVVDSLDVWRSEGWVGTDVEALDTKLLNATTAVFDVR